MVIKRNFQFGVFLNKLVNKFGHFTYQSIIFALYQFTTVRYNTSIIFIRNKTRFLIKDVKKKKEILLPKL